MPDRCCRAEPERPLLRARTLHVDGDLVGRIAELIDLFARADDILEQTLGDAMSREALGLDAVEEADADDGAD